MSVSVARASELGRVAAGKSVGAAKSVGQPVAACHVADQVCGLMAGHPGGGDKQRPGGAFPAHYRHGAGGGAEGCLGDADDRHPKLGAGMRAQAGPGRRGPGRRIRRRSATSRRPDHPGPHAAAAVRAGRTARNGRAAPRPPARCGRTAYGERWYRRPPLRPPALRRRADSARPRRRTRLRSAACLLAPSTGCTTASVARDEPRHGQRIRACHGTARPGPAPEGTHICADLVPFPPVPGGFQ